MSGSLICHKHSKNGMWGWRRSFFVLSRPRRQLIWIVMAGTAVQTTAVPCPPGRERISQCAREAAVDVERLAGDEARVFTGQERDGADQIGGFLRTLDRLHIEDHLEQRLVRHVAGGVPPKRARRARQARRGGVEGDALRTEFGGE